MRRSPLRRGKPLSRGKGLKRAPFKRPKWSDDEHAEIVPCRVPQRRAAIAKVNHARAKKRRDRDFGPHGKIVIPRLPCAVCYPWWYTRPDDVIRDAMAEAFAQPEYFAVVSVPMHFEHSRGAGGTAKDCVPGCWLCHGSQHGDGVETFAAAHPGNDLPALAARLWRLSPARMMEEE